MQYRQMLIKIPYLAIMILIVILLSTTLANAQNSAPIKLQYDLIAATHTNQLEITLTIPRLSNENEVILQLPTQFGPYDRLFEHIKITNVCGGKISDTDNRAVKKLTLNDKVAMVTYTVEQPFSGYPYDPLQLFSTIIQTDFIHFPGHNVFITPQIENEVNIVLNWSKLSYDSDWSVINSFGYINNSVKHKRQTLQLNDIYQLLDASYMIGHLSIYHQQIDNNDFYTAIYGDFAYIEHQELVDLSKIIIKEQRDFWKDHEYPYFLITVVSYDNSNKQGTTGYAVPNTFSILLPEDEDITALPSNTFITYSHGHLLTNNNHVKVMDYLPSFISHEYFHKWNNDSYLDYQEEHPLYFSWLTEGLTDYYANQILLAAELTDYETYVKHYNDTLKNYFTSPARNMTLDELIEHAWRDMHAVMQPYWRGHILAHNWHAKTKTNKQYTHNMLDNFMRAIVRTGNNNPLSMSNLVTIAQQHSIRELQQDINHFYYNGHLLLPHPQSVGLCYDLIETAYDSYQVPQFKLNSENYRRYGEKCFQWFN